MGTKRTLPEIYDPPRQSWREVLEEARQRRVFALSLYDSGMIYRDIGLELGNVSAGRARQIVQKALKEAGRK
jgi:hypothetical protein